MPAPNKRRGFTLIELMITISIIAILAAVGMTTFSQSQKLARDAKRKGDLRSIAIALELYYQRYGHYPCASTWVYSTSASAFWISNTSNLAGGGETCGGSATATADPFDTNFINALPKDPLNSGSYYYTYWSRGDGYAGPPPCSNQMGKAYYLYAKLENPSDPDTHIKKQYKYCNTLFGTFNLPQGSGAAINDFFFVTAE